MLLSTTSTIENKEIKEYLGLVFGESVNGVNFIKDIGAGLRNIIGGRSSGYEEELVEMRKQCLNEMIKRAKEIGADGVIGLKFDFQVLGQAGNMLLLNVSGTAVKF